MVSIEERENLLRFRSLIDSEYKVVNDSIEFIKPFCSKIGANGMHNVAIMFNNKISEMVRIYHEHGMEFFKDGLVNESVYDYLITAEDECVNILKKIINYIKTKKIIFPSTDEYLKNMIQRYNDISDEMYAFDLKEDFNQALFNFCVIEAKEGRIIDKEDTIKSIMPDLKALGIKYDNIENAFFNPFEIVQSMKKELALVQVKDINK